MLAEQGHATFIFFNLSLLILISFGIIMVNKFVVISLAIFLIISVNAVVLNVWYAETREMFKTVKQSVKFK